MASVRAIYIGGGQSGSVVPSTTASDYIETLFTSEGVAAVAQTTQDDTFSASRQPRGSVRTGFNVGGPMNGRLRYGAYDHIMESALFSPNWATLQTGSVKKIVGTITVDHSAKTIVATAGSPFGGLAVGDWVRLEKTSYQNDGICVRISTWTDADNIAYDSWSKLPTTDASPVASVTVRAGERITVGTTDRLHTYVKKLAQIGTTSYQSFLGCQFDQFGVSLSPGDLSSFSTQVRGRKLVPDFTGDFNLDSNGDLVASGGTNIQIDNYTTTGFTAAPSTSVLSTATNTGGAIMIDGVPSLVVSNFDFNLANNIQGEQTIFVFGDYAVEPGVVGLTGNLNAIFAGTDLLEKFVNDQSARLACYITGTDNKGYIFDIPNVRLGGGESGFNNDALVRLGFTWSAEVDATTSRAFQVVRFDAS
jgi:hypothetical protein